MVSSVSAFDQRIGSNAMQATPAARVCSARSVARKLVRLAQAVRLSGKISSNASARLYVLLRLAGQKDAKRQIGCFVRHECPA